MAGFRWFQVVLGSFLVVSDGFRWFQMVSGGFKWFEIFPRFSPLALTLLHLSKILTWPTCLTDVLFRKIYYLAKCKSS